MPYGVAFNVARVVSSLGGPVDEAVVERADSDDTHAYYVHLDIRRNHHPRSTPSDGVVDGARVIGSVCGETGQIAIRYRDQGHPPRARE